MFCCKHIVDYTKLKLYETKNVKKEEEQKFYLPLQILIILLTIISLCFGSTFTANVGTFISIIIFMVKFIKSKLKKEKFYFLPDPEDNYVEIQYKTKTQAIESKITCHPECSVVKFVRDESNRKYYIYNTSNSLNKYLN